MVIRKRVKKNLNEAVNDLFFKSLKFIRENLRYIYFIVCIFLLFGLIGFLFPTFFEKQIIEMVRGLVEKTYGLDAFELTGFIFLNNVLSSFLALILGIFFGLFPLFTIILNGYVIGFVSNFAVAEGGVLVLWRLLPHGIFEIPAIMISAGLGFKIGFSLLYDFVKKLKNISKPFSYILILLLFIFSIFSFIPIFILSLVDNNLRKKFLNNFFGSVKVFIFVVIPLLIVAAVIEGVLIYFLG